MTNITIESNIPGAVQSFTYVRNTHYLKLTDEQGNETRLVEQGIIRYTCQRCGFFFYAESNRANICPCCRNEDIHQEWMKPQIALVPQKVSNFEMQKGKKS